VLRRLARSLFVLALVLFPAAPIARAAANDPSNGIDLVKVQGVVDPALYDYVVGTVRAADRPGGAVILQIDSRGTYGDRAERLAAFLRTVRVPVVAWVGPSGARVDGGALFVVYGSSLVAISPGAGIGPARPFDAAVRASRETPSTVRTLGDRLSALAQGAGASSSGVRSLVEGASLAAGPAVARGAATVAAPDLGTLLQKLDGKTVRTASGSVTLHTLDSSRQPVAVRFHEMGPVRRVLHAVSTPTAVYVLVVLGLWFLVFELTQPGWGMAGIGGVLALALGGYGLAVTPMHWLGFVILLVGMALQGLDVVLRRLAWFTAAGTVLFAAGSVLAWWGVSDAIDLSWWLIALFTVAGAIFFGFGLTVALRARERVRTATVGLVGLVGEARTDLDPEGGVHVKGAMWRARSSNGRIPKGTRIRVRGVDGLVLRVEPEPGEP
jgi:membrane-bound serine protease (ClpP class)